MTTPPRAPARIRKSIAPDALISFEDGKRYRWLTPHLRSRGLTAAEYCEKWGLPAEYPMVAADYSAKRSAMAKAAGLGRKATATLPVTPPETIVAELLKPRVRGKLSLFGRSASGNS